ncbi:MAG: precorrin-2 dehydrogenase/sirohydrochlorin ferrochelatase family protein [Anaerolineae bacterium]
MAYCPIILTGLLAAVVVGGGQVAERKVRVLLQADAAVTVVSPRLTPALAQLAQDGRIRVTARSYHPGDLTGARLAIAATSDPAVNAAVADEADQCGCLVNVVDDPLRCTFHMPAIVRRGEIIIGVSTSGASPALARHLRKVIETTLGPEYEPLAGILAELRTRLRDWTPEEDQAALPWDRLIDALLPLLRAGENQAARQIADRFAAAAVQGVEG